MNYGIIILTIDILAILITAPLGAICTLTFGPFLLEKDQIEEDNGNKNNL